MKNMKMIIHVVNSFLEAREPPPGGRFAFVNTPSSLKGLPARLERDVSCW